MWDKSGNCCLTFACGCWIFVFFYTYVYVLYITVVNKSIRHFVYLWFFVADNIFFIPLLSNFQMLLEKRQNNLIIKKTMN